MKKKILSLILLLAMCISMVALTSCGSGEGGGNGGGGDVPTVPDFIVPEGGFDMNKEITITFYHTMGANLRGVLEEYIPEFNKLYPNITVKHEQVGDYNGVRDQINTEITVGNQPSMAYCYPDHVALYNVAKAVIPLDTLINSTLQHEVKYTNDEGEEVTETVTLGLTQEQKDDFIKGYYEEGKQFGDGKMYTLPMSKSTEVLYYNKTFFDKHNLKVPTTWDEMEEVCKKIKEINPDSIPLGYDSEANWFITMCEQYGSPYTSASGESKFLFDNETNRAFVEKFRKWYQNGWVTTEEISGGYTSDLFTKSADESGNSYMCIGSSAGASYQQPGKINDEFEFEVKIATIPQLDPSKPKVISQGPSLCIFNQDDPQEVLASWLFVKFLTTSVEFQASFSMESGYMPVIKSAAENEIYKTDFLAPAVEDGTANIQAQSVMVGIQQQDAYYTSPAFNGSSDARDQVGLLMQKCFTGTAANDDEVKALIKKAFEEAVEECEYGLDS